MTSKLEEKLQDHAYRTAFVASQINIGVSFQIKALMKARGWTQEQLAERTGMLQPRISAVLKPGKVRPNIETLRRFAEAFDCGLLVRFAPFSELADWSESFDPEQFDVPSFENEARLNEVSATKKLEYFVVGSWEMPIHGSGALGEPKEPQLVTAMTAQLTGPVNAPQIFKVAECHVPKRLGDEWKVISDSRLEGQWRQ